MELESKDSPREWSLRGDTVVRGVSVVSLVVMLTVDVGDGACFLGAAGAMLPDLGVLGDLRLGGDFGSGDVSLLRLCTFGSR